MKSKVKAGILFIIGYILSPFSWWNDFIINLPIAYLFALPFGLISKSLFFPMMIIGYWMTNILGLILMHSGMKKITSKENKKEDLKKHIIISIIYTIIIIVLAKFGILKFPIEYFKK